MLLQIVECLFDRVKEWRIWWEVLDIDIPTRTKINNPLRLMNRSIVHNDDIPTPRSIIASWQYMVFKPILKYLSSYTALI
jgi:hypothetical protein